jgi:hypothetical protein
VKGQTKRELTNIQEYLDYWFPSGQQDHTHLTKEQAKIEGLLKPRSNKDRPSKTKKLIDSLRQALKECEEKNLPNLKVTSEPATMGTAYPAFYEVKDNPISRDLSIWLLKLLDQYAKECYADSVLCDRLNEGFSLSTFPKIIEKDSIIFLEENTDTLTVGYWGGDYGSSWISFPRFYYYHTPTSFEGFVAWLRKQSSK